KALQAGTSHDLGQNFAKAFDLKFQDKDGETRFAWNTSWGVSTRLVGAVVMQHGDDNGLILPPRIAPIQVVIVPIYSSDEDRSLVLGVADKLRAELAPAVRVRVDARDQHKPGWKFAEWEQKGVPLRVEIGPKDVAKAQVMLARRDTREKQPIPIEGAAALIAARLEEIQAALFDRAKKFRDEHTFLANDYDELKAIVEKGGFALAHWDGTRETEALVKEETKATIRCIPLHGDTEPGRCVRSGNESKQRVYFARAY
ncbi:MAG: proline--tRNA ligase, partial [Candidatus Latescibacterota bacterium]